MSQRMTDHEFAGRFGGIGMDNRAQDLAREAVRARSEEARLLEERRKQMETIKALADALERWRHLITVNVPGVGNVLPKDVSDALRLAGRLP